MQMGCKVKKRCRFVKRYSACASESGKKQTERGQKGVWGEGGYDTDIRVGGEKRVTSFGNKGGGKKGSRKVGENRMLSAF